MLKYPVLLATLILTVVTPRDAFAESERPERDSDDYANYVVNTGIQQPLTRTQRAAIS